MGIRKLAMVAALGASMASAPVIAQTTQAQSLSVASAARGGADMQDASAQSDRGRERGRAFQGGTQTYIIAFFVIVVIALGIYFAFDEDEGSISV